jgi:hypothetical protein
MLGRMQKALYREPAALYRAAEDCYNRVRLGLALQNRRNHPI